MSWFAGWVDWVVGDVLLLDCGAFLKSLPEAVGEGECKYHRVSALLRVLLYTGEDLYIQR